MWNSIQGFVNSSNLCSQFIFVGNLICGHKYVCCKTYYVCGTHMVADLLLLLMNKNIILDFVEEPVKLEKLA